MKKRYMFALLVIAATAFFIVNIILSSYFDEKTFSPADIPRFGQKMWTYNMNKYEWRKYSNNDDDESKSEIILQYLGFEEGNGITLYKLITGNFQVPKEDVWIGENSQEFLTGKKLYSYFPKSFEYFEIVFNGVKFMPKKLSVTDVENIFKGYTVLKLSEIQKGNFAVEFSKDNNRFIVLNDMADKDFYKYYIVPNDSKKLEIGEFSNMIKVSDSVDIKIQRLEGCTKAYPCYEIHVK